MEKRGIQTEKGNPNRQITVDNKLLKEIKARSTRLYNWSKEEATRPQGKESIMTQRWQAQHEMNRSATQSDYSKAKTLKQSAALFNFLHSNGITSMQQLHEKISAMNSAYYDLRGQIVSGERRMKVLDEHLKMWAQYKKHKGTRCQLDKVKPGKRELFEQCHSAELALYEAAARYLENLKAAGEPITPKKWQAEMDKLSAQKDLQYQQMKAMREEIKALEGLRKAAEKLEKEQPDQKRKKGDHEL